VRGFQAAVQDADEAVAELAERGVAYPCHVQARTANARRLRSPTWGMTCATAGSPVGETDHCEAAVSRPAQAKGLTLVRGRRRALQAWRPPDGASDISGTGDALERDQVTMNDGATRFGPTSSRW